jgi:methionyl-tRNA synthetase
MISLDDFKKVEIKVGEILSVEKVPDTDKLLRLMVSFAEEKPRQVISGIAPYFPDPQVLVGKKCAFVTNLEPRGIRGFESQAMLLAVVGEEKAFSSLEVHQGVKAGSVVR